MSIQFENIQILSSPLVFDDVSSFVINCDSLDNFKPGDVTSLQYYSSDNIYIYKYIDNSYYILLNREKDNYFYKNLQEYITMGQATNIRGIPIKSFSLSNKNIRVFYTDDNFIDDTEEHTNLSSLKTNIVGDPSTEIFDKSIIFDYVPLNDSILDDNLIYNNKSNDNYIFLYAPLNVNYKNQFDVDDYIYELRINTIPTAFFEVTKTSILVSYTNILTVLQVKINKAEFCRVNDISDLNNFVLTIKNKTITDIKTLSYSYYSYFMKPYISYDPMTETVDDITINCRYDLSIKTIDRTKDITYNMNDPTLYSHSTAHAVNKTALIDNDITITVNDRDICLRALTSTYIDINLINQSGEYVYLLSNNEVNKTNEYYKMSAKENNKSVYILDIDNPNLRINVESIKDVDEKTTFTFSISFLKVESDKLPAINNNTLNRNDIVSVITVNFNLIINGADKYAFSKDELDILQNISSFNTNTLNTTFGNSTLFTIAANDNIVLNDSELNSEELKTYIENGNKDLTYINSYFESFDIICYGVYIDHMILKDNNIGGIFFNRLNSILDNDGVLEDRIKVCNVIERNNVGDLCNDGFNEKALTYRIDDDEKRIVIVPDEMFKLFNFLNSTSYSGSYYINDVTDDIINDDNTTTGKIYNSSLALYPSADFSFVAEDQGLDTFLTSDAYIDYYPIKYRITKKNNSEFVWSLYIGETLRDLQVEKIIHITVKEDENANTQETSETSDTTNYIYDTDSEVTFPTNVIIKILMQTDNGEAISVDAAKYIGTIHNDSNYPVLIKDISIVNFASDDKLFKVNGTTLADDSFMKYSIEGETDFIQCDSLNIGKYLDHSDITTLTGNMFILKPNGKINVNIYNSTDPENLPDNFGKEDSIIDYSSSLNYELYYILKNDDVDNINVPYTFRETGNTNATNMETTLAVFPKIPKNNTDDAFYRYDNTVLNVLNKIIIKRSAIFRLILNKMDIATFSEAVNYKAFADKAIDLLESDNVNKHPLDLDMYCGYPNISFMEMENINYLESGKNFLYTKIFDEIKRTYTKNLSGNDKITKEQQINQAIGIQVIAKTKYNGSDEYNMAIITNYVDLQNNQNNYMPKLNRLNGSLYHILKIENKHEDLYDYRIEVDGKVYNEGDLIYNKYANEKALHKFRLYYKPKYEVIDNMDNFYGIGTAVNVSFTDELGHLQKDVQCYRGNFFLYFNQNGEEVAYTTSNPMFNGRDFYAKSTAILTDDNAFDIDKKTFVEINIQETGSLGSNPDYTMTNVGFSDGLCLKEYIDYLVTHPGVQPSETALKLADFNEDGKITYEDLNILYSVMWEYGCLIGDVDNPNLGVINLSSYGVHDVYILQRYIDEVCNNQKTFEKFISDYNCSQYRKNYKVYKTPTMPNPTLPNMYDVTSLYAAIRYIFMERMIKYNNSVENMSAHIDGDSAFYPVFGRNTLAGKIVLETPLNLKNINLIQNKDNWILADRFEGCIDGTKPIVPNLLIDSDNNKGLLHKYSTLTRDQLKSILNSKNILSEISYYGNTNIIEYISDDLKYEVKGNSGISTLKVPRIEENNNKNEYIVTASSTVEGIFQIVNNTTEKLNIEINQRRRNNTDLNEPYTIRVNETQVDKLIVDNYQPIYVLQPESTLEVYVQFKDNSIIGSDYFTFLDVRVQNNYHKKYIDNNIKWDSYLIKLRNIQNYDINFNIVKDLLPYKFYEEYDNEENKHHISEYYNLDTTNFFNTVDINNFNKKSLYSTYMYLDKFLIFNSDTVKDNNDYQLLIPEKILDRKLYIGDHTLTIVTTKFNGLINYQTYYITLIDQNVYDKNNKINYFNDRSEYYNRYFINNDRKSIIPRNPELNDYNDRQYEDELFLDSNGNVSMVTKDYSTSKDNYYLYKFTEIIQHYMNFSDYIVDSEQYLFEKNYQEVLHYYNITKNQYIDFLTNVNNKLNKSTGEIYNLIDNIQEIYFKSFDAELEDINEYLNNGEQTPSSPSTPSNNFKRRLFNDDGILFEYKTFNIAHVTDTTLISDFELQIFSENEFDYNRDKDKHYIVTNESISTDPTIYVVPLIQEVNSANVIELKNLFVKDNLNKKLVLKLRDIFDNPHISSAENYAIYAKVNCNLYSYVLIFNLYNSENCLSLNDTSDFKLSYADVCERSITNNTNSTITFSISFHNNSANRDTDLEPDKVYTTSDLGFTLASGQLNSTMCVEYHSAMGMHENNSEIITLPPYASCTFKIYGGFADGPIKTVTPKPIKFDDSQTTYEQTLLEVITKYKFISGTLNIKLLSINHEEVDNLYNYNNNGGLTTISKKFIYIPYPTVFISDLYDDNNLYDIIQYKKVANLTDSLLLIINDLSTNIEGNFTVNGNLKNVELNSDEFDSYLPLRTNHIFSTTRLPSDDNNFSTNPNTYNDSYKILYSDITALNDTITLDRVFPIIISSNLNTINKPSYTFTIHKTVSLTTRTIFKNIENLTYQTHDFNSPYYQTISDLTDISVFDNTNNLCEGSIHSIPASPDFYGYNSLLSNANEYISSYIESYHINDEDGIFYIYPVEISTLPTPSSSTFEGNPDTHGTVPVVNFNGNEYVIIDDLVTGLYDMPFDGEHLLRDQMLNPNGDFDNLSKVYSYIIGNVNNLYKDHTIDVLTENIRTLIKSIYKIKSDLATLQQNINYQNTELSKKADVKEFKEWINENVFALAEYEYSIQELFADIYYLSNKGLKPSEITKEIDGTIDTTFTKNISLRESLPLINVYREYADIKYYSGDNSDNTIIFYKDRMSGSTIFNTNKTSPFITTTEPANTIPIGYTNLMGYYYKKYWINSISDNVHSIWYKKNFIETSKLYNITQPLHEENNINYYNHA